jgi:hypothetical protein
MAENEMTEEELRHVRALKWFLERNGMDAEAETLATAPVETQRVLIKVFHRWIEQPENFGIAWKWTAKLYPVIRAYAWLKDKATNFFSSIKIS